MKIKNKFGVEYENNLLLCAQKSTLKMVGKDHAVAYGRLYSLS